MHPKKGQTKNTQILFLHGCPSFASSTKKTTEKKTEKQKKKKERPPRSQERSAESDRFRVLLPLGLDEAEASLGVEELHRAGAVTSEAKSEKKNVTKWLNAG